MSIKKRIFKRSVNAIISSKKIRKMAVKQIDKMIYKNIIESDSIPSLPKERVQRYNYLSSVLYQLSKNLDQSYIKPSVARKIIDVFTGGDLKTDRGQNLNPIKEIYKEKYGEYPPLFCVLSPTKACNLHCIGCYATSDKTSTPKLEYKIARQVVSDVRNKFGSRFMTISGGEPFLYKDDQKTIFDLYEEFNDMFFLTYTNATLIDEKVAARLAELGNVAPCISVEGFEKQTDERRGKGVHNKILNAMQNLRNVGVPFGISITATRKNIDLLMKEELYDYYFNELGVTFMFQFQIMPVGRGKDVIDLMISPQQRVDLYHLWDRLLSEKRYPVADFWNSGSLSDGCIAYGRWHGYFYVNWHGNVMPCVFVPFYVHNVKELYAQGKSLEDALHSRFFKNGRRWQLEHGFGNPLNRKNGLMPCSIKDNFDNFKKNILSKEVKAENPDADTMRNDPEYSAILRRYDEELEKLTSVIYEQEFLNDTFKKK